jgi:hypothetical protein
MIRLAKSQEFRPLGFWLRLLMPVLKSQLHGDFDRTGSIPRKENMIQTMTHSLREPLRKPDRDRMTHPQICHMRNFMKLLDDRSIDLLDPMTEQIAPQRTCTIEILLAMDVGHPTSFGLLDNQPVVVRHLGERMP